MKRILLAALATLYLYSVAEAQQPSRVRLCYMVGNTCQNADTSNPFPVAVISGGGGGGSSSGGGGGSGGGVLTPTGRASLAVTTASDRVALPNADAVVFIKNIGVTAARFKLGNGSVTAATTDFLISAGDNIAVAVGANTHLAAITSTGNTTLELTQGTLSTSVAVSGGTIAATQSGTWNARVQDTSGNGITSAARGSERAMSVQIVDGSGNQITSFGPSAVTQSGNWSVRVQDGSGNNLTSALRGSERPLSVQIVDGSGTQITAFGGSGGTASNFGSAVPAQGTAAGWSDGSNMQAPRVFDMDTGGGFQYVPGANLRISGSGGSIEAKGQQTMANSIPVVLPSDQLGTAGTAASGVLTVQGIASMTPFLANPGTAANWAVGANGSAIPTNSQLVGLSDGTNTRVWLNAANALNSTGNGIGTAQIVGQFDDTSPTAITENQFGNLRMSANRNLYSTIRDAAGNERGLNVNSSGQATVSVDGGSVFNANGQAVMASSSPVAIASDQSAIPTKSEGQTGVIPGTHVTYLGANASGGTGGLLKGLISCDLHAKYDASDNGSITLVTGVSSRKVYICGYMLSTGGTAVNLKLREGSDANCATNGADLTPAWQMSTNDKIGFHSPFWSGLVVSTNAYYVCVNASAPQAHQAELWYTIL